MALLADSLPALIITYFRNNKQFMQLTDNNSLFPHLHTGTSGQKNLSN